MKKIVCTLVVMLLFVATLMVMSACGETSETTTEPATTTTVPAITSTVPVVTSTVPAVTTTTPKATEVTLPEGYVEYQNEDIRFAYPESFEKNDDSTVLLIDAMTGNNVTVVYEDKNDFYATMDLSDYEREFVPLLEDMGITISNASVAQTKNGAGLAITKITHTATMEGISMKQTQMITTVGNKTYTVTVTEVQSDAVLVNTVFNTLAHAN